MSNSKHLFIEFFMKANLLNESSFSIEELTKINKTFSSNCQEKHFIHLLTKKDFFESKNVKKVCREGIPFKYFRRIIMNLFKFNIDENETNYKSTKEKVMSYLNNDEKLKGKSLYSLLSNTNSLYISSILFDSSLKIDSFQKKSNYLNESGLESLLSIQLMLKSKFPDIIYSPLIIRLNYILHLFLEEYEIYYLLKNLIQLNIKRDDLENLKWHLRFSSFDHHQLYSSILDSYKELSSQEDYVGIDYLISIGFDPLLLIGDIVSGFFIDYFNFEGLYRILTMFLREGIKSVYRITYSIIKIATSKIVIIKNTDDIISTVRMVIRNIKDYDKLFEIGFNFKFSGHKKVIDIIYNKLNNIVSQGKECVNIKKSNHQPEIITIDENTLLNKDNVMSIWDRLPLFYKKSKQIEMIYSNKMVDNDKTFERLYKIIKTRKEICFNQDETSMIILIKPKYINEKNEEKILGFLVNGWIFPYENHIFKGSYETLLKVVYFYYSTQEYKEVLKENDDDLKSELDVNHFSVLQLENEDKEKIEYSLLVENESLVINQIHKLINKDGEDLKLTENKRMIIEIKNTLENVYIDKDFFDISLSIDSGQYEIDVIEMYILNK